ncbi:MAG: hypothetical protein A2571_02790 [Candidatus Vogelbacteria bacterium RIFOXYD1_FULL_44_32]|uniref:Penicillin-binding protein transpeptidase domain-containing protein n=1 Tax=Candidatus Vogelbacteria bacterium RIFOXYD1_FULL_44_32 TaxID=1802438 RepID=A0A1G2QFB7_9BACT|nr:MAG: hypothetical protein A2571_02790 [Candidatus Vogelbacteria bacterium RIFOXYD1_FULL_44_32]
MKSRSVWRLRLIGGAIFLVVAIFAVRLFYLQIVKGSEYNDQADRQYLRSARTFFDRGSIYFTGKNGNVVPAASLKQEFLLTANPQHIAKPDEVAKLLLPILSGLDKDEFLAQVGNKKKVYVEIKSGLTATEAEKIQNLNIKGISVFKEKKRYYPVGRTASHVLGFMGYRDDEYTGLYGLEREYNNVLTHRGSGSFASFFAEIFLNAKSAVSTDAVGGEGDIVLTIEPVVQNQIEKMLAETVTKYKADAGGAVVMDPHTGEIIAMVALPNFNPGERQKDIIALPNPLVERVFEMGSVVKPLTLAAGIDKGVVNPATTYNDTGSVVLNNRTIMNHDQKAMGVVNMQEVINNSLNTGAVFIMQKLGKDSFRRYMLSYGLGEKTGIDLPGEVAGLISNLRSPRDIEYATAAFGQGIALTPIGITRAFAVLANGGKMVRPHVVKEIRYAVGTVKTIKPDINTKPVLKRETTEAVTEMLIEAVDTALLGGSLKLANWTVAAKTGTAQMSDGKGRYLEDQYLHSFFGYYPAYKPRFITFVYIINPKGVQFSSDSLSRPFMETAEFLLNYYEIPPDR